MSDCSSAAWAFDQFKLLVERRFVDLAALLRIDPAQ